MQQSYLELLVELGEAWGTCREILWLPVANYLSLDKSYRQAEGEAQSEPGPINAN